MYQGQLRSPAELVKILIEQDILFGDEDIGRQNYAFLEDHLNASAREDGFDRGDEDSFDSDEFPKVVYKDGE